MTDEGFILSVESKVKEKETKAKEKDQRNEAEKLKKAARDACKDKWKQIKIVSKPIWCSSPRYRFGNTCNIQTCAIAMYTLATKQSIL